MIQSSNSSRCSDAFFFRNNWSQPCWYPLPGTFVAYFCGTVALKGWSVKFWLTVTLKVWVVRRKWPVTETFSVMKLWNTFSLLDFLKGFLCCLYKYSFFLNISPIYWLQQISKLLIDLFLFGWILIKNDRLSTVSDYLYFGDPLTEATQRLDTKGRFKGIDVKNHYGLCKICFFLEVFQVVGCNQPVSNTFLEAISMYLYKVFIHIHNYIYGHIVCNPSVFQETELLSYGFGLDFGFLRCRHLPGGGQSTSCKENPAVCMAEIQHEFFGTHAKVALIWWICCFSVKCSWKVVEVYK